MRSPQVRDLFCFNLEKGSPLPPNSSGLRSFSACTVRWKALTLSKYETAWRTMSDSLSDLLARPPRATIMFINLFDLNIRPSFAFSAY